MPTLTVSRERAIPRPARVVMQLEKQCELEPHPNPHVPPRRPTAHEFAALQDIMVHLSYPPLRDLLQASANTNEGQDRLKGSKGKEKQQGETYGACSTGLGDRVGHVREKVVDKRRFRDACDSEWGDAAEEGPGGEGGGAGGKKLKDKRQKETKHKQEVKARGKGSGSRRRCEEGARKVPAQPRKEPVPGMRRVKHLRAQPQNQHVQAMRRVEHLRAQPPKKQVQGMRRGEHLRAQPQKEHVQGMRRGGHL